jgi:hypothetical protein
MDSTPDDDEIKCCKATTTTADDTTGCPDDEKKGKKPATVEDAALGCLFNAKKATTTSTSNSRTKSVRGAIPYGKRSFLCKTNPKAWRDIMRRWARLGESRYLQSVRLPLPRSNGDGVVKDTKKVGRLAAEKADRHITALRRVAYLGLGFDEDMKVGVAHVPDKPQQANDGGKAEGEEAVAAAVEAWLRDEGMISTLTTMNEEEVAIDETAKSEEIGVDASIDNNDDQKGKKDTRRKIERVAMIHFHPSIHPYLPVEGPKGGLTGNKSDMWRVPLDVGRAIGYTDEYRCPEPDSIGAHSFFAVPNYDLQSAIADVANAEKLYKDRIKKIKAEDKALMKLATKNPKKLVKRMQDVRMENMQLERDTAELREFLKVEESTTSVMITNTSKLQTRIEKMTRKIDKLEGKTRPKKAGNTVSTKSRKWWTKTATLEPEQRKLFDDTFNADQRRRDLAKRGVQVTCELCGQEYTKQTTARGVPPGRKNCCPDVKCKFQCKAFMVDGVRCPNNRATFKRGDKVEKRPTCGSKGCKRGGVPIVVPKLPVIQTKKPIPYTDEEKRMLLEGVAKFGVGKWKEILMEYDFTENNRTAVNLKDLYRTLRRKSSKKVDDGMVGVPEFQMQGDTMVPELQMQGDTMVAELQMQGETLVEV